MPTLGQRRLSFALTPWVASDLHLRTAFPEPLLP